MNANKNENYKSDILLKAKKTKIRDFLARQNRLIWNVPKQRQRFTFFQ